MPISNFPKGFANGVSIRGIPLLSLYPGKVFWVSNATTLLVGQQGGSNGNKGTFDSPFATIDFAVGRCTALRGDIIVAKANHAEAVTAAAGLALDVAGIAIVFLGSGASRAKITFSTVTGADLDVDAEGITLVNPRFVAGIDALTGPIDINAAGCAIVNGLYEDAAALATTDCIVADANADDLLIDGWEYRVSTTGTQKQSNIQIAGATRPVLKGIRITGDFGTGVIENGTAWIDATLDDVIIDNAATGPVVGILLQGTSSGQARDVNIRVASGTTYLTAANDMQFFNCQGVGVDADGGEQIGAIIATSVEGKIDVIDAFHDIPAQDSTDDVVMSDVIGGKTDTASEAVATSDSLVSYAKGAIQMHLTPAADSTDAVTVSDTVGDKTDTASNVVVGTDSLMSYVKGLHTNGVRVLKSSAVGTTTTPKTLFTITGDSIHVIAIYGTVITAIQNQATTQQIQAVTTTPATTTNMSTAVDTINDAAGTVYTFVGPTGVLTPTTVGLVLIDYGSVTVTPTQWIVPIGVIGVDAGAVSTGDVEWVLEYYHNPAATVVAA